MGVARLGADTRENGAVSAVGVSFTGHEGHSTLQSPLADTNHMLRKAALTQK